MSIGWIAESELIAVLWCGDRTPREGVPENGVPYQGPTTKHTSAEAVYRGYTDDIHRAVTRTRATGSQQLRELTEVGYETPYCRRVRVPT